MTTAAIPVGYRLEWKPGDYCFYCVDMYERESEKYKDSARVWGLFTEPHERCNAEIAVYKGRYWVQPKHVYNKNLDGFVPLYLGPVIREPGYDEVELFAFPSIIEIKLRTTHPHLFDD